VDIEFADAPERHRYELRTADELIGIVTYHVADDVITLIHTEVGSAHSGHGYAATLARGALDDARSRGLRVVPSCPYVASYIEKHPEYADLVS
jgi:predicted GNAT family acetyltransferase